MGHDVDQPRKGPRRRVRTGNLWEESPAASPVGTLIEQLTVIPAVRVFSGLGGGLIDHVVVCGRRAAIISRARTPNCAPNCCSRT